MHRTSGDELGQNYSATSASWANMRSRLLVRQTQSLSARPCGYGTDGVGLNRNGLQGAFLFAKS